MSSLSPNDIILSGSFSGAGKLSLNQYNIITQENQLKRKEQKEKKFDRKYFIIPNYALPLYNEDNTVIHRTNFKLKKFLEEEDIQKENSSLISEKENENIIKKVFQGDNYKYYNLHQDRIKFDKKYGKKNTKNDISYTPGYYKTNSNNFYKIKLGLKWKNITGRKEQKIMYDKKDIFTDISENKNSKLEKKTNENKCFIDMSKQTQRNGFPKNNNLRERCEKKFVPLNSKLVKENWIKFCKKPLVAVSPFSNDTYELFGYRRVSSSDLKKNKRILKKVLTPQTSTKNNIVNINLYRKKNKFPYLVKYHSTIGFNKSTKIKNKNTPPLCILYPNYNSIEERIKMMVVYNSNQKQINKNYKQNEFKGINLNDLYDASKSYEKIYGHKLSSVPNFEKMISRPNDDKLPSFMKGIHNGMSSFLNTEKSLILNNFTERKEYEDKIKKKRQNLINKFLETKKGKKRKKEDASKEMLKKFNNLYSNFYKSLKINKNKELFQKEKSYKYLKLNNN